MHRALLTAVAVLAVAGCYTGSGTPLSDIDTGGNAGAEAAVVKPTGLPCTVADLLTKYCLACHGPGGGSAGTALASMADLMKTAKSDPTKNEAQLALARMQAGTMPSGSTRPSASEISAFAAWVSSGTPAGTCMPPDAGGPDPFAGPHVCTSGSYYSGGEGSTMEPGNGCISCHAGSFEAPRFSIAGTVYPTAHEPSRCKASGESGAQVAITDNNNQVHLLSVNSVGSFSTTATIALPYRAEVRYGGKVRAMSAAQSSGDCNVCHSENGTNGAPGRILLPQ